MEWSELKDASKDQEIRAKEAKEKEKGKKCYIGDLLEGQQLGLHIRIRGKRVGIDHHNSYEARTQW